MIEKRSSRRRRLAAAASIFEFGTSTASCVPGSTIHVGAGGPVLLIGKVDRCGQVVQRGEQETDFAACDHPFAAGQDE